MLLINNSDPYFDQFITVYGPIGIYIWYISFDNITPIPAEISLITIGYFASHGAFNPVLAAIAAFAGLFTVDMIYFTLTKTGNKMIRRHTKKKHHYTVQYYSAKMRKNMAGTLITLIFIPRMRIFGPILAAIAGASWKKFMLIDATGLAAFVALFISAGIIFHKSLSRLFSTMNKTGNIVFIIAMLFISVLIIVLQYRRNSRRLKMK